MKSYADLERMRKYLGVFGWCGGDVADRDVEVVVVVVTATRRLFAWLELELSRWRTSEEVGHITPAYISVRDPRPSLQRLQKIFLEHKFKWVF